MELTGYIRVPESAGTLTPPENLAKRLWFTRDHLAMARALGTLEHLEMALVALALMAALGLAWRRAR